MKSNKNSKSIKVVISIYNTANNKQDMKGHITLPKCKSKQGKPLHTTFNSSLEIGTKITNLIKKFYKKEYHDETRYWLCRCEL